nr:MAG TPA_asm: hypothetical protein [Bacteriophage sp.]DAL74319.1 MAG TPA: hypothetical protein [Caudoviricetes sp.]DAT98146.1 MAG TPA: hypothetical protein [Caudoviricetes sp.]
MGFTSSLSAPPYQLLHFTPVYVLWQPLYATLQ